MKLNERVKNAFLRENDSKFHFLEKCTFRDVNTTQKPQMDIQFNSKAFATFSKSSRCMKVSISVLWRIRATSSNVSISLLIDTDAKYRLIDCV